MIKRLTRLLCRSEIEKYEKEIEELKEEVWKRKAKPSNPVLIKETKNQCLAMKCVCGNDLVGTFERESGFDFTCNNCEANLAGIITGFSEDIKKKLNDARIKKTRRKNEIFGHLNELNNLVGTANE